MTANQGQPVTLTIQQEQDSSLFGKVRTVQSLTEKYSMQILAITRCCLENCTETISNYVILKDETACDAKT